MVAREETCVKCGKKFIIGGVFRQSTCEQCSMTENKVYWTKEQRDDIDAENRVYDRETAITKIEGDDDDYDQNPI
jgi:hypothetical protein